MKRALVIGGTGFIGLNLVDALLADGWHVRVPVRRHSITLFLRSRDVERVRVDFDAPDALAAAMRGCDVVFMAAGHYPRYSVDPIAEIARGVSQVRAVADAALQAGVATFVYTSSTGALAHVEGRAVEERDIPPERPDASVYRAVKWAMERELERFVGRGLRTITMIPSGCIGPWDARVGTGRLLVGVVRGELPFWVEGTVDLVDVEDVAHAHVAAARVGAAGARYCLGGHAVRVSELLRTIRDRYGGALPAPLSLEAARERADRSEREAAASRARVAVPRELVDLVEHGQAVSSAVAARDLGFAARPLQASLDRAHAWFDAQGYLRTPKGRDACSRPPMDAAPARSS